MRVAAPPLLVTVPPPTPSDSEGIVWRAPVRSKTAPLETLTGLVADNVPGR